MAEMPFGEIGNRLSDLFGDEVRSVEVRFNIDEPITVTVEQYLTKETAMGVVKALESQTWRVVESEEVIERNLGCLPSEE